ncbi:Uncharacterised protein [Clostridioides difficile]|nr:hypothetical protein CDIF101085_02062 [Clostridioides difficile]VIB08620.1 Uncharacterised protein [Clostridioides difficile]VIG11235.1 Uncharacterised protein [Clostridioides difficile]VIG22331.1 Uncharacterised protein [Clostridioides difficile]VIG38509.1 Uncharacterised protein [Clostridioides difficile]
MDKLYICSPKGIEEVEILEETKSRLKRFLYTENI